jgi:hypothetical protein
VAVPDFQFVITMSDGLYGLTRQDRYWNKYAREALGDELVRHHQENIPKHFRLGAAQQYGYMQRRQTTKNKKRKVWRKPANLDLVRSGVTAKAIMGARQITFAGRMGGPGRGGPGLTGRLNMWLPFPVRRDNPPGRITVEEIKKEIAAVSDAEGQQIAIRVGMGIVNRINAYHGPMRRV